MVEYFLIAFFVMLEGFFSGSETGFYSLNRIRLHFRRKTRWPGAGILSYIVSRPQMAISSMLIGTNISVYTGTVLCASKLRGYGINAADFYSSLIMPPVLLVFAEIMPKFLFQRRADTLMYRLAPVHRFFYFLFYPLLLILRAVLRILDRILGRDPRQGGEMFSAEKFRYAIDESAALGVLSRYQQKMANNILKVKLRGLQNIMIPMENVTTVEATATRAELEKVFKEHRFSRFPVRVGADGDLVGIVNVIDLVGYDKPDVRAKDLGRGLVRLNERMSVAEALYNLQRAGQQMAVIDGEEGGVVGIVTVKDLVEEIVGELHAW